MSEHRPESGRRIKVCHIITNLPVGGAPENTLLTVEGMMNMPRYDVELVLGPSEGELIKRAYRNGVKVEVIPEMERNIHPLKDAVTVARLCRLMAERRYDIVHTHMSKAGIVGRQAAAMVKTPIVVHTLHGLVFHDYQPWYVNRFYWGIKMLMARHTDYFISVSQLIADKAVREHLMKADEIRTIYSGMELGWFLDAQIDRDAVREKLGIPKDSLVVGKVGRLFPLKGHEQLYPAIPEVVKAVPNVRFLIVGDGELEPQLRAQAEQMGVSENIIYAGWVPRERIPETLGAMDVLVHTSLREGLARVLPQALAMGRPCVAYNLDGAPEVVIDGQTGFLVEPNDTPGLSRALIRLLQDDEGRKRMGEAGRRLVDPRFRAEKMVSDIVEVYEMLLARKGYPPPG